MLFIFLRGDSGAEAPTVFGQARVDRHFSEAQHDGRALGDDEPGRIDAAQQKEYGSGRMAAEIHFRDRAEPGESLRPRLYAGFFRKLAQSAVFRRLAGLGSATERGDHARIMDVRLVVAEL